jgi:hypothetical protein
MLVELAIENYAVIDRLRVRFYDGLNLLTGETGSGKSIVVDALGLLFGGRASGDMIRSGEDRARISGIFDVRGHRAIRAALEPAGLESEEGELLIEREVLAGGKSRAFIGSRPVTASLLRELAPYLGDIHGQHDQQLLFSSEAQRDILDAFAASENLRAELAEMFSQLRRAESELAELERGEQENCACSICGNSSGGRLKACACSRVRILRSRTSGASCRTWAVFRRQRAGLTPRSMIRRNRRWCWRGWRQRGSRSWRASTRCSRKFATP